MYRAVDRRHARERLFDNEGYRRSRDRVARRRRTTRLRGYRDAVLAGAASRARWAHGRPAVVAPGWAARCTAADLGRRPLRLAEDGRFARKRRATLETRHRRGLSRDHLGLSRWRARTAHHWKVVGAPFA